MIRFHFTDGPEEEPREPDERLERFVSREWWVVRFCVIVLALGGAADLLGLIP